MENLQKFEPYFGLTAGGGHLGSNEYDRALRESVGVTRVFYLYFLNIVTNMFKYEDVPDGMDIDYFEHQMALRGMCSVVNDPEYGILNPQATVIDTNIYGKATQIQAIAKNYSKKFFKDDFVLIGNTNNFIPTFLYIDYFVQKIANIQAIESININAQKTPVIFKGTREQRILLQEEFKKYDGNAWYMFLEKDAIGGIDSITTNAPFIADKLNQQIRYYTDLFLTFIGIDNANGIYKKERSIIDEVTANDEIISITKSSMLNSRKKGLDEVNKLFGSSITVSFNENISEFVNASIESESI